MTQKLTLEQAVIITGFTGRLIAPFEVFHADVEKRMGRPVFTHEMGDKHTMEQVTELYRDDFMAMLPEECNP